MSRRVDRALGIKHFTVAGVQQWPRKRKRFTVGRALKIVLLVLAVAGAGRVLYDTSHCAVGVRCAD